MIARLKYVSRERTGLLMYCRQIPADLREFYNGQLQRRQSLGTHDPGEAARKALRLGKEDDDIWAALRNGAQDIESARETIQNTAMQLKIHALVGNLVKARAGPPQPLQPSQPPQPHRAGPPQPRFAEALALYFRKHSEKDEKFVADTNRVFNFAKEVIGDRTLSSIKRADARLILNSMLTMGWKTATVRRNMAVLSAIFNLGVLELELNLKNPFAAQKIPNMLEDAKEVPSIQ